MHFRKIAWPIFEKCSSIGRKWGLGSHIHNIMAAWAVDREFVDIVGPAGAPFGRLGPPLGPHWDAFGSTLVSRWSPWDTFGVHVERLGSPGGHLGDPLNSRPDLGTSSASLYAK